MSETKKTDSSPRPELPSVAALRRSTLFALVGVAVLIVAVVLPAEYGIDVTGIGRILGLTRMGEIKMSLHKEALDEGTVASIDGESIQFSEIPPVSQDEATTEPMPETAPVLDTVPNRTDSISITLQPNEGKEIKLVMDKGAQVTYRWWSDGGKVNFDAHADSKPLKIKYHNYMKGSETSSEGVLEAAFDGSHGWFWRNRTPSIVSVTLHVRGLYSDLIMPK